MWADHLTMRMRCRIKGLLLLICRFTFVCFVISTALSLLEHLIGYHESGGIVVNLRTDDDRLTTLSEEEEVHSGLSLALILTYQRCGSSFLGELFDENPEAFYLYEPMDALYVSMYGTEEGYNVPTDITTYWNGTTRLYPANEITSQTDYLQNLLTCKMDEVPVEFFTHKYWFLFAPTHMSSHTRYRQCCHKAGIRLRKCKALLPKTTCPQLFGQNWNKSYTCQNELHKAESANADIREYKSCLKELRKRTQPCVSLLQEICLNSSMRAIKTVRTPMAVADKLLGHLPDLKVVHLIRDPRAVTVSRRKHGSFHGRASRGDLIKEAKFYCRDVIRDLNLRSQFPAEYKKRIRQVIYDEFVLNPMEESVNIYKFLHTQLPNSTRGFMRDSIANSSVISSSWQEKLTYKEARNIMEICKDVYNKLNFDWQ